MRWRHWSTCLVWAKTWASRMFSWKTRVTVSDWRPTKFSVGAMAVWRQWKRYYLPLIRFVLATKYVSCTFCSKSTYLKSITSTVSPYLLYHFRPSTLTSHIIFFEILIIELSTLFFRAHLLRSEHGINWCRLLKLYEPSMAEWWSFVQPPMEITATALVGLQGKWDAKPTSICQG